MNNDTFAPTNPRATHLKYVRLKTIGFILWPRTDRLFHSDVAEGCARAPDLSRVRDLVISAGFASVHGGVVRCWGRSESLDKDHLPEDTALLALQLGLAQEAVEESEAQAALRSLACWLGVGGYNAPTVDAKVFEQKIRDGVAALVGKNEV